jgi:hypothetical protein
MRKVLIFTAGALIVSVVVACSLPSLYRARTVVQLPDNDSARFLYAAISGSDVQNAVIDAIGLIRVLGVRDGDAARKELRRMTESIFDSKLLTVSVEVVGRDATLAAGIANAYRDALTGAYTEFENSRAEMESARRLRDGAAAQDTPVRFPGLVVIESASVPQHPSGPDRLLIILTTVVVSFGFALLVAAIRGRQQMIGQTDRLNDGPER